MRIRNLVAIIAVVALFVQTTATLAQVALASNKTLDNWLLLGERAVDYTLDRDVVSVKESDLTFTSLKFIVKNGTINVHKFTVHFKDGETRDINLADEVNKTNDGRVLELKDNTRAIEKVTFWYDTKNSADSKAIVELWGKK